MISIKNAETQAIAISFACALLGVVMGFVVYLDFAHLFENGNWIWKLGALGVSLLIGTLLAAVSEWLRETIKVGKMEWRGKSTAILTTAIVLMTFELFVLVTETFTDAFFEQRRALINIAANVAGQNPAALTSENTDFVKLLGALDGAYPAVRQAPNVSELSNFPKREKQFVPSDILGKLDRPYPVVSQAPNVSELSNVPKGEKQFVPSDILGKLDRPYPVVRRAPNFSKLFEIPKEKQAAPSDLATRLSKGIDPLTPVALDVSYLHQLKLQQENILRRIIHLMPATERVPLFTFDSSDELKILNEKLRSSPSYDEDTLPWEYNCSLQLDEVENKLQELEEKIKTSEAFKKFEGQKGTFGFTFGFDFSRLTPDQKRQRLADICRDTLRNIDDHDRIFLLKRGMNAVLARHDLYEPSVFAILAENKLSPSIEKNPPETQPDTRLKNIESQRDICERLRAQTNPGNLDIPCIQLVSTKSADGKDALITSSEMMELNRYLLSISLSDELIPRLFLNWSDLFMLVAVWILTAMALSWFLTRSIFLIPSGKPIVSLRFTSKTAFIALVCASLMMGIAVAVFRIGELFKQLAFYTPSTLCSPTFEHIFSNGPRGSGFLGLGIGAIPILVVSLKSGNIFGWHVPGWITLPICLLVALWMAFRLSPNLQRWWSKLMAWLPLFGVLFFSVSTVFGDIGYLMLLVLVTWAIPVFGLATMLPYLELSSTMPRRWGAIAIAAGIALAAVTIVRISSIAPVIFIPTCVILIVFGTFIYFRQPLVRDAWPWLAITVAFCFMCSIFVQEATFSGVLRNLHSITAEMPLTDDDNACHRPKDLLNFEGYLGVPIQNELHAALPVKTSESVPFDNASDEDIRAALNLEIALVGTLGFWLVIALLAAWALRRKVEEEMAKAANDARLIS